MRGKRKLYGKRNTSGCLRNRRAEIHAQLREQDKSRPAQDGRPLIDSKTSHPSPPLPPKKQNKTKQTKPNQNKIKQKTKQTSPPPPPKKKVKLIVGA